MAVIGSLAVNIVARIDQLQKGINDAKKSVDSLGGRLSSSIGVLGKWQSAVLSAAGIGGLGALVNMHIREIDALGDVSAKLGIATEKLSGLQYAASLSGIETESFNMSLQNMIRRISEATQGTGEAVGALKDLRIPIASIAQLKPDQQIGMIADAMNRVGSQAERVRIAYDLFGRSGIEMVNLMNEGSVGMAALTAEAERLGIAVNSIEVGKIQELDDALTRLKAGFKGLGREAIIGVAPPLQGLVDLSSEVLRNMRLLGRAIGAGVVGGAQPGGGFSIGQAERAFGDVFAVEKAARLQLEASKIYAESAKRIAAQERPGQFLIDSVRPLGERIGKLTEQTRNLWDVFRTFPAKVRVDDLIGQLDSFRRFGQAFNRPLEPPRPGNLLGSLFDQLKAFGKFGSALAFQPQQVTPGVNAALEAGTREAFIASRQGQRQQLLDEINQLTKKEVKLSEVGNNLLRGILDAVKQTGQVLSIPSA